jgi:hypothetical protein
MNAIRGRVRDGHVEVDSTLVEGTEVVVLVPGEQPPFDVDEEELAQLQACIAEADRGNVIAAGDLYARLRPQR